MSVTRLTALATVVACLALPALPAAADDNDTVRRGHCGNGTGWKVKASPEDGRIEVEAEVDSDVVGQRWRWRLRHDGSLTAKGTRKTAAPSGSFEVRRVVVDLSGKDRLVFRAVHPRTGEVCRGRVTV